MNDTKEWVKLPDLTLVIYPVNDDGSEDQEVVDLEHKDTYPNMSDTPIPYDGYHQFGGSDKAGHWHELRVWLDHPLAQEK